ncbi:MAG: hypothetical protein ACRCX2_32195 [Paraclostridium sp.]
MLHIYNQNLEYIDSIPRSMSQVEEFGISTLYPKWQTNWYLSEIKYNYPKLESGNLVEKTTEELKLEGIISLQDGEVIINNELVVKPKPNGVKIEWQSPNWVETATQEEKEEAIRMDIISKSSELLKIQSAGFNNLELEKELETLKKLHLEITHQIAIK